MVVSEHSNSPRKRKAPEQGETVLLNGAESLTADEGTVIIGHRVGAGVASRSSLLAGIGSAPGMAPLPESISREDVMLWEAACIVETQPTTAELITILKVADVLADEDPAPWVSNFTDRVLQTDWEDSASADEMASHLLTLPLHLLQHTLTSCIDASSLDTLFSNFPPTLHDALISCAAANGTLIVPTTADALLFLHISKAIVPEPGLVSLELPELETFSAAAAALLARAISAHPSLMSVDLVKTCISPEALRTLSAGLRKNSLSALSTCRISAASHCGVAAALAELLKKVSSLRSAAIDLQPGGGADETPRAGLQSDVQTAFNPAYLPNLEELVLSEKVQASSDEPSKWGKLLGFIRAPALSHITLQTDAVYTARRALLTSLARFPSLRQLTIDGDSLQSAQRQTPVGTRVATLPALLELTVQGACCWLPLQMAHTVAAAAWPSLTRLQLRNHGHNLKACGTMLGMHAATGVQPVIRAAFQQLWDVVGRCAQLRHLEVRLLSRAWVGAEAVEHSEAIAGCLGQLKQLTYLALQPEDVLCLCLHLGDCTLHGRVLAPVLQRLTTLQELHLCDPGASLKVDRPDALLKGIVKLKGLRVLGLWVEGLQMRKVAEGAEKLPELKRLELLHAMFSWEQEQHMIALKASLPGLEVVACGREPAPGDSSDDIDSDDE